MAERYLVAESQGGGRLLVVLRGREWRLKVLISWHENAQAMFYKEKIPRANAMPRPLCVQRNHQGETTCNDILCQVDADACNASTHRDIASEDHVCLLT